jgi:hypothetical protein
MHFICDWRSQLSEPLPWNLERTGNTLFFFSNFRSRTLPRRGVLSDVMGWGSGRVSTTKENRSKAQKLNQANQSLGLNPRMFPCKSRVKLNQQEKYVFKHLTILSYVESGYLSRYSDRLRAGRPGFDSRHCKIFLFSTASRQGLGSYQPPLQWVPGALYPGVKRPGREADHSPPSIAKVKNCWAVPPPPAPMYSWHSA